MKRKPTPLGVNVLSASLSTGDLAEEALMGRHDVAIEYLLDAKPKDRSRDGLLRALRAQLGLSPIRLGSLQHLKLFPPTNVNPKKGFVTMRRVAEARFSFTGSERLWRANPGLDQPFPFKAVFATASLGFRALVEGTDLGAFEEEVKRQAAILGHLLPNLDEPAAKFNAIIDPYLVQTAGIWFSLEPEDVDRLASTSLFADPYRTVRQPRRR